MPQQPVRSATPLTRPLSLTRLASLRSCTAEPNLGTASTVKVALEGTYNGTDWVVIETILPTDVDYQNQSGDVPSWFRVVPVTEYIRFRIANGGGLTFKIWLAE